MNEPLIKGVPMPADPDAAVRVNNALNNVLKRGMNNLTSDEISNHVKRGLSTIADINKRIPTAGTGAAGLVTQRDNLVKNLGNYIESGDLSGMADKLEMDKTGNIMKPGTGGTLEAHGLKFKDSYERAATLGEKAGAAGRVATQWLFGGNAKQIGARSGLVLGGIYGANKVMDWLR